MPGIPDAVPADLGQVVAEIALEAATRQLERTLRMQRTLATSGAC